MALILPPLLSLSPSHTQTQLIPSGATASVTVRPQKKLLLVTADGLKLFFFFLLLFDSCQQESLQ